MMGELSSERTPLVIAAEINMIKHQTEKLVLANFIEIGRRLKEVKNMLPHGKWGQWLKEYVGFSQSKADNLMRLYDQYGSAQLPGPNSSSQKPEHSGLQHLSYTKALILLGIPEEEREQFIMEMDIENLSTRELKKAVEERKRAQEEKERAEQENAELRQALKEAREESTKLEKECDSLKTETERLQKCKQELEQDVERKEMENKKLKESTSWQSCQKMRNELSAAQIKLLTSKVAFKYENLTKAFKELTYELNLLAENDPHVHREYQKMLDDFLTKALRERMGGRGKSNRVQ